MVKISLTKTEVIIEHGGITFRFFRKEDGDADIRTEGFYPIKALLLWIEKARRIYGQVKDIDIDIGNTLEEVA